MPRQPATALRMTLFEQGVYSYGVGEPPESVGTLPRRVGGHPRHVEVHPVSVGLSARLVGAWPQVVGVAARHGGRSFDCDELPAGFAEC